MSVTITGFTPSSGPVGTLVTVTGSGFTLSNDETIQFSGDCPLILPQGGTQTPGQFVVVVPGGAATGPFTLSNQNGTASSPGSFTVTTGPIARRRGPWYACTTHPDRPETWWIVTDGQDPVNLLAAAQGLLAAKFSTQPGGPQGFEYQDELKDLVVCRKPRAVRLVGAAGIQAYENENPG